MSPPSSPSESESPKIILTADETMMSQYRWGIFLGFSTCMPQGIMPDWLYFKLFSPPVPRRDGRAVLSNLGIRIVEASLLEEGFKREDVAVVHPLDIEDIAGSRTEIVGVGGHDFLGINSPTCEFVDLAQTGPPYNRKKFLELMENPVIKSEDTTIVAGGQSAWQLSDEKLMEKLGIDHVFKGECELSLPEVFRLIIEGEDLPKIIEGEEPSGDEIPCLRGGTIHGLVEIMRGCGRGCKFCTPTMQRLRHRPLKKVLKDVGVNVSFGQRETCLHSEDVLRYGTKSIEAREDKILKLYEKVSSLEGVEGIGASHIALATAANHPRLVEELGEMASQYGQPWMGAQTGIETGSPELIKKYMKGKPKPWKPGDWPEVVRQSFALLEENNWIVAATLIMGLPGETSDDVIATIELVEDLRNMRCKSLIVPMYFVSMEGTALDKKESFFKENMTHAHWQLLGECMYHNGKIAVELASKKLKKLGGGPLDLLGNPLLWAIRYMASGCKAYSKSMREGEPPRDFSQDDENYVIPDIERDRRSRGVMLPRMGFVRELLH